MFGKLGTGTKSGYREVFPCK